MRDLEFLILKTLHRGPNHGFGITLHIQTVSDGLLRVEEGSLYPALHRMEKAGLIAGAWKTTDNSRRAKFYSLTAAGRKALAGAEQEWAKLHKGMQKFLRFA